MKFPLISVLIPAYNAEKYIGGAIESILKQTYKEFELIILDDASTDRTWEIIQDYVKQDRRILAYKNKKNMYIAASRNILVKFAKGKYIAWQDADDLSMPERLEHQLVYMEKHEEVGILGGYLKFFNDKDKKTSIRKYSNNDEYLRKKIFRYSPVAQPTAMIRRKIFKEVGEYDLKYPPAEDIDMAFRIGQLYKFANLQEVTLLYRENNKSATFKKLKKIELDTIEIRKKYAKENYKMNKTDNIYNFFQYLSIYFIPPATKIKLFNYLRNN